MGEIAEAADVSRSTVCNWFAAHAEVLAACRHVGQVRLASAVDEATAKDTSAVRRGLAHATDRFAVPWT